MLFKNVILGLDNERKRWTLASLPVSVCVMDVRGENRNMLMLLATYFYLDEHLTDVLVVVVKNQKRKL